MLIIHALDYDLAVIYQLVHFIFKNLKTSLKNFQFHERDLIFSNFLAQR